MHTFLLRYLNGLFLIPSDNWGNTIQWFRKISKTKVSLNKFGIEAQIDSGTLSKIERVKQGISLQCLSQIADFYGVRVSKLIEEYENLNE